MVNEIVTFLHNFLCITIENFLTEELLGINKKCVFFLSFFIYFFQLTQNW